MKILVLGGTKFFGKILVNMLTQEGHAVTVASTGATPVVFELPVERLYLDRA